MELVPPKLHKSPPVEKGTFEKATTIFSNKLSLWVKALLNSAPGNFEKAQDKDSEYGYEMCVLGRRSYAM